MRSFALASLIPLAFGIFASAAPTPGSSSGLGSGGDGPILVDADVDILRRGSSGPIDINAMVIDDIDILRRDGEKTLESILCDVVSSVDGLVEKISNLGAVGCTVETLDPILTEVKDVLTDAINEVNGLKGLAAGTILKSVDGLLDATGLAKLLANVVIIVVKLVELVLSLVSSVVKDDVLSLLVDILCLVGELLTCVLGLVGSVLTGVLAILCTLVEDVLSIFIQLKIQIVTDLFKL